MPFLWGGQLARARPLCVLLLYKHLYLDDDPLRTDEPSVIIKRKEDVRFVGMNANSETVSSLHPKLTYLQ